MIGMHSWTKPDTHDGRGKRGIRLILLVRRRWRGPSTVFARWSVLLEEQREMGL